MKLTLLKSKGVLRHQTIPRKQFLNTRVTFVSSISLRFANKAMEKEKHSIPIFEEIVQDISGASQG